MAMDHGASVHQGKGGKPADHSSANHAGPSSHLLKEKVEATVQTDGSYEQEIVYVVVFPGESCPDEKRQLLTRSLLASKCSYNGNNDSVTASVDLVAEQSNAGKAEQQLALFKENDQGNYRNVANNKLVQQTEKMAPLYNQRSTPNNSDSNSVKHSDEHKEQKHDLSKGTHFEVKQDRSKTEDRKTISLIDNDSDSRRKSRRRVTVDVQRNEVKHKAGVAASETVSDFTIHRKPRECVRRHYLVRIKNCNTQNRSSSSKISKQKSNKTRPGKRLSQSADKVRARSKHTSYSLRNNTPKRKNSDCSAERLKQNKLQESSPYSNNALKMPCHLTDKPGGGKMKSCLSKGSPPNVAVENQECLTEETRKQREEKLALHQDKNCMCSSTETGKDTEPASKVPKLDASSVSLDLARLSGDKLFVLTVKKDEGQQTEQRHYILRPDSAVPTLSALSNSSTSNSDSGIKGKSPPTSNGGVKKERRPALTEGHSRQGGVESTKCADVLAVTGNEDRSPSRRPRGGRRTRQSHARPHTCQVCGQAFTQLKYLNQHLKEHDSSWKRFPCGECDATFAYQFQLKAHGMQAHQWQKPFPCVECGASFKARSSLDNHMRVHTGERPFVCKVCGAAFKANGNLIDHMLKHSDDRPHVCSHCNFAFKRSYDLKKHMRIHTNTKPFACKVCGLQFRLSGSMISHMRTHTGERPYLCEECGTAFTKAIGLARHLRRHRGERPFVCRCCGAAFTLRGGLKLHMLRRHSTDRAFLCSHCGKAFAASADLKMHMRNHTGEKPYVCKDCSATFPQMSQLKAHMLKHSEKRPHVCRECGFAFKRSGDLKAHMSMHTGIRPHVCNICGAAFAKPGNLKKHLKTHECKEKKASVV